jgi:hypothetical protein
MGTTRTLPRIIGTLFPISTEFGFSAAMRPGIPFDSKPGPPTYASSAGLMVAEIHDGLHRNEKGAASNRS